MNQKRKSLRKDKKGFTGLEAAIVLTAFIVVAAVFAYVVLNAGFFTTEKAKQVVHTGVGMATSSCELSGDIIGKGGKAINSTEYTKVDYVLATLQLTAGQNPIRIASNSSTSNQTDQWFIVTYTDEETYSNSADWRRSWVGDNDGDDILEYGEKAEINVTVPTSAMLQNSTTATNTKFTMEFKPAEGATLTFTKQTPSTIDAVMIMY
jgi:flagellin FlaB